MPELSRFYGIIVRMYAEMGSKHHTPHIHVEYQGKEAEYSLDGKLLNGELPTRQKKLVEAWMVIHEEELKANWELLQTDGTIKKIAPLE